MCLSFAFYLQMRYSWCALSKNKLPWSDVCDELKNTGAIHWVSFQSSIHAIF